ncbi:SCY1-like protein 2 [Geodia barretti]|uniref:SCY1-like protein 2 n=1 Tax=Geodia barretti TaxID=519541 RepID=A0AA35SEV2_GEOBA|nr:SCY1-like protein 2 [Geodia barretti]
MDLLLKKTSPEDVRQHVLPTIIASLETTNTQLQELCISLIPSFATTVDYSSMKHSIIPRLTALMVSCESVSLRVKCLVAVGKMLDALDKHIVHDHILPLLQQIPSRAPGVLMAILGIYHAVMKNKKIGMDKVLLATRILPFVVPLSVEPTLNVAQFKQFMVVIRDMLQSVETEQLTQLEQLSQMEEQTRSTVEFARDVAEAKAMEDTINKFEETFGSGGSHDSHVIQRRGSATPKSPPSGYGLTAAKSSSNDGGDMFAGLLPEQPSMATTSTFSPSPQLPKSTSPHTLPTLPPPSIFPTSKTSSGTASKPMTSSHTSSSVSGMGMGVSGGASLQPIQTGVSGMGMGVSGSSQLRQSSWNTGGVGGTGMGLSGMGMRPTQTGGNQQQPLKSVPVQKSHSGSGMGYTPPAGYRGTGMGMGTESGGTGMGSGSGRIGMGSGSGGIGMGTGSGGMGMWSGNSGIGIQNTQSNQHLNPQPINPQPTGDGGSLFSGMQVHASSEASKGLTNNTSWTNQIAGRSHMAGGDLIGGSAPYVPTETRSATGWSSDVNKGKVAVLADPNAGWSGNISQPVQSANWMSQDQQTLTPNVAPLNNWTPNQQMMAPMQPNAAPSGNWTSQNLSQPSVMAPMQPNIAPSGNRTIPMQYQQQPFAQSGNWTAQNQSTGVASTAASLMMGGPLLQPGNYSNQAPAAQPRQPNTSGNPFADLSFLE